MANIFTFLEIWQHAVHTFERFYRHLAELHGQSHGRLQHPHELAGGQAVAGDIGDVGHQTTVGLDDVDQIAARIGEKSGFRNGKQILSGSVAVHTNLRSP